jgi:hypothetical protein
VATPKHLSARHSIASIQLNRRDDSTHISIQVLFSKANNDKPAHPTQQAGAGSVTAHTPYYSGNGVCACDVDTASGSSRCESVVSEGKACGFSDTVNSLHDRQWRKSSVRSSTTCVTQMDWPYTGGVMRDGSVLSQSAVDGGTCGLLGRLPEYEYRYDQAPSLTAITGPSRL